MSVIIRDKKVYIPLDGVMQETKNPELIGLAILDSIDKQQDKEAVCNKLTEYIKLKGLRKTAERYRILNEIFTFEDKFNAKDIHESTKKDFLMSIATIYNTLKILRECNIITPVNQTNHIFNTTYFKLV